MAKTFSFTLTTSDAKTNARTGVIHTPHGDIETPAFVPVGTQGTVKSLTPDDLEYLHTNLFFVNTYHMYLRPGLEVIKHVGGLHAFMHWSHPIITDSGGFQVFSLGSKIVGRSGEAEASLVRITQDGVTFKSHWDGSEHIFTPETSMHYQWILGSDMHIAFDDCTPYGVSMKQAEKSMERTHRWARESLSAHKVFDKEKGKNAPYQALYGSIQGSVFASLRKKSAAYISAMDFDGIAIGGVSVGESKREMADVLDWVCPILPADKPRHLLGVGEIDDIFVLVEHGMDTFDCVQPTRLARMGMVFQYPLNGAKNSTHQIDITKSSFQNDLSPIDAACDCYTCSHFTKAYVHHLFRVRELLAYRLATIHNVSVINGLIRQIRLAIQDGSFVALKKKWS